MKIDHHSKAESDAKQAKRDLERLRGEGEVLGSSGFTRMATKARDHVMGADAEDQADMAEVWGRRVGRVLGIAFAIYLVYWLITFLTR